MKFFLGLLLTLAAFAMATTQTNPPQKNIIVSFPPDTPNSVYDAAKQQILDAGGMITHEYQLIK
jgi:hypothetical protein